MPLTIITPPVDPVKAEAAGLTTATYKTPAEIMGWTSVGMTPVLTNGVVEINCGAQADSIARQMRAAKAGVVEVVSCCSYSCLSGTPVGHPCWGVGMMDGTGAGVALSFYSSPASMQLSNLAAGVHTSILANASTPAGLTLNQGCGKLWLRITRAGTSYSGQYSLDGRVWSNPLTLAAAVATPTTAMVGQFHKLAGVGAIVSSKLIIHGAAIA